MADNLYKLLIDDYPDYVDDDFFKDAFAMMMEKEKGLEKYAKDIKVSDDNRESLADYNNVNGLITIYINSIMCDKGAVLNKRILGLECLRHEIEHARSVQRLHELREDIESLLLRCSLRDYARDHGIDILRNLDKFDEDSYWFHKVEKETYLVDPDERLAEIRGWKFMLSLLRKHNGETKDIANVLSMLTKSYRRGYKSNGVYLEAPSYEFVLRMGMYHQYYLLHKQVNEKQYVFDTRVTLGLPITMQEYNQGIAKKVYTKSR